MIGRSGKISNPDMYVVSAFDCFNLGSDLNFNGGYRKLNRITDYLVYLNKLSSLFAVVCLRKGNATARRDCCEGIFCNTKPLSFNTASPFASDKGDCV